MFLYNPHINKLSHKNTHFINEKIWALNFQKLFQLRFAYTLRVCAAKTLVFFEEFQGHSFIKLFPYKNGITL